MVIQSTDVCVIGGGIIGAAVAHELAGRGREVLILEKEERLARHQSGRNSGEIHTGIFYRPGTLKARLSVEGAVLMKRFCRERGIPMEECGKTIVAAAEAELPALDRLLAQAEANGVKGVRRLSPEEAREFEPHVGGVGALRVPAAAVADFSAVTRELARSAAVTFGARVTSIRGSVVRTSAGDEIRARRVVVCAGLYSDRLARARTRIVPFRGKYAELKAKTLARGLIYPVPDPRFPFLGVHVTRRVTGEVEVGPNALPAAKREGYLLGDFDWRDALEQAAFPGTWVMFAAHARLGLREALRSLSLERMARAARRLVPEIRASDLAWGRAGVRAQALDPDGRLVDDFRIVRRGPAVHVVNAPSPAATASLALAVLIADGVGAQ